MAIVDFQLPRAVRDTGRFIDVHLPAGVMARGDVARLFPGKVMDVPQTFKLVAARITLTCSAEVGNRYIEFGWESPLNTLNVFYSPACGASTTISLSIGPCGAPGGSASYGETGGYINIGDGLPIEGDGCIKFCIDSNLSGDSWGFNALFESINRSKEEWQKLLML